MFIRLIMYFQIWIYCHYQILEYQLSHRTCL